MARAPPGRFVGARAPARLCARVCPPRRTRRVGSALAPFPPIPTPHPTPPSAPPPLSSPNPITRQPPPCRTRAAQGGRHGARARRPARKPALEPNPNNAPFFLFFFAARRVREGIFRWPNFFGSERPPYSPPPARRSRSPFGGGSVCWGVRNRNRNRRRPAGALRTFFVFFFFGGRRPRGPRPFPLPLGVPTGRSPPPFKKKKASQSHLPRAKKSLGARGGRERGAKPFFFEISRSALSRARGRAAPRRRKRAVKERSRPAARRARAFGADFRRKRGAVFFFFFSPRPRRARNLRLFLRVSRVVQGAPRPPPRRRHSACEGWRHVHVGRGGPVQNIERHLPPRPRPRALPLNPLPPTPPHPARSRPQRRAARRGPPPAAARRSPRIRLAKRRRGARACGRRALQRARRG